MPRRSLAIPFALAGVLLAGNSSGCARPSPDPDPGLDSACSSEPRGDVRFPLAPSGAPEAVPEWLWEHRCAVRIVDIRQSEELEEGMIPGAQHVALGELEGELSSWDPNQPLVFVCRSGRRSARAVELAERHGFSRAASLTGGMLAWAQLGLPTSASVPGSAEHLARGMSTPSESSDSEAALQQTHVPQVRAASLLLEGFESCVDGREGHPVIGTPGGDLGELVLALSTIEVLGEFELDSQTVLALFESHINGFGRIYLHTDTQALDELANRVPGAPQDRAALESWLRSPPPEARPAILQAVVEPETIGCGHLRLVRSFPGEYDVRPALVQQLLQAYFKTLWARPENVEFVVLDGEHHEGGVIIVEPERVVHPYSNIPALPPIIGDRAYFVAHPAATAFIRGQYVDFFLDKLPQLGARGIDRRAFERALDERGAHHADETLRRLGAGLPTYTLEFEEGSPVLSSDQPR